MKIDFAATLRKERASLAEKLRLKRPRIIHGARIAMTLDAGDLEDLAELDQKLLATWAGPRLRELAFEVGRARRIKNSAEVVINKTTGTEQEARALGLRARVFADLVSFALAERRLAAEARRGLATDSALAPNADEA